MKTLVVDIYEEYFDWEIVQVEAFVHSYSGVYTLVNDSLDVERQIRRLIMTRKGDGVQMMTSVVGDVIYMKIVLLFTTHDLGKEYNFSYILDYLNSIGQKMTSEIPLAKIEEAGGFIYLEDVWSDDLEAVFSALNELGIEDFSITKHSKTFDRGAGNRVESILLGMVSGVGVETIKYLGTKISGKLLGRGVTNIGVLDINKVKGDLCSLTGQNFNGAYVSEFKKVDENKFRLILQTRYDQVTCICNTRGEIENFETLQFTQTRI